MSKEFWAEFATLLDKREPEALEYRLHYNDGGEIYLCTMQNHPTNTQYIVVTKDVYDMYYDYYVVEGHLKKIVRNSGYRVQLQKSDDGFKVVKGHAGIILNDEEYTNVEYYEYKNC
jgi:hypothetical protein